MSAGSGASNLGYGNISPFSKFDSNYVNVTNSNNPSIFSSNNTSPYLGLKGAVNNVNAAKSYIPGLCFTGGKINSKLLKKKIKNISKKYKMRKSKYSYNSIKRKIKLKYSLKSKKNMRNKRNMRNMRKTTFKNKRKNLTGGWSQYQNNMPITNSYSIGGILNPYQSALASPPPIIQLPNCTNCVDNYNHFINKGFQSKGN